LPDENFNKNPNDAEKRPEKGYTVCLKARKKPDFVSGITTPLSQKTSKLQQYQKKFLQKSCLALYWNTDLP